MKLTKRQATHCDRWTHIQAEHIEIFLHTADFAGKVMVNLQNKVISYNAKQNHVNLR